MQAYCRRKMPPSHIETTYHRCALCLIAYLETRATDMIPYGIVGACGALPVKKQSLALVKLGSVLMYQPASLLLTGRNVDFNLAWQYLFRFWDSKLQNSVVELCRDLVRINRHGKLKLASECSKRSFTAKRLFTFG